MPGLSFDAADLLQAEAIGEISPVAVIGDELVPFERRRQRLPPCNRFVQLRQIGG